MTNFKEDFDEDNEPLNRDCDCPGWKKSIGQINNAQVLAYNHGMKYTGDFFNYCPWCGVQIRVKKTSPSPDKFCITTEDGNCISTDPGCMHNVKPKKDIKS